MSERRRWFSLQAGASNWLWLSVAVMVLDQWTKSVVVERFDEFDRVVLLPVLELMRLQQEVTDASLEKTLAEPAREEIHADRGQHVCDPRRQEHQRHFRPSGFGQKAADQDERQELLPQHGVRFALRALEGACTLRLRHALEVTEGLEQRDLQPVVADHAADIARAAVEGEKVLLEDLHPVEARRLQVPGIICCPLHHHLEVPCEPRTSRQGTVSETQSRGCGLALGTDAVDNQ